MTNVSGVVTYFILPETKGSRKKKKKPPLPENEKGLVITQNSIKELICPVDLEVKILNV